MQSDASPSPLAPGRLGFGHAAVGYVVAIVVAVLAPLLVIGLQSPSGPDQSYLALPVQYLLLLVLGALVVRLWTASAYRPSHLGFVWPASRAQWLLGAAGGLAFVVISQIASRLLPSIGESGAQVANQIGFGQSLLRDVVLVVTIGALGPIGEEMIYRGVIFRSLYDAFSRRPSLRRVAFVVPALISAILFALSHGGEGQSRQVVFLTLFGLIAAWLYWHTGSLLVPVFAHVVTNMISVVLVAYQPGFSQPWVWALVPLIPAIGVGLVVLLWKGLGRTTE